MSSVKNLPFVTIEKCNRYRQESLKIEAERDALLQLCKDMLPVFQAARPLVLNLERLKDAVSSK